MVSKHDLIVGILVLVAGIVIYGFAPAAAVPGAGFLFQKGEAHATTHYIGGAVAIIFSLVGIVLYKKVSKLTLGVSILGLILGLLFALDVPATPLYGALVPHGQAMAATGGLTLLLGLVAVAGSAALKTKQ